MTPPTVQFIPDLGPKLILDFAGTFDVNFGSGSADTDPTIVLPTTWSTDYPSFSYFAVRTGSVEGVQWVFSNSADALQFVADFPDDGTVNFALYLDYFGTTFTTVSGWSWTLTNNNTRAKILWTTSNWNTTVSIGTFLTNTDYTITGS